MKIEVNIEIIVGIQFVRDSEGRIIRRNVLFAFVAKEVRKGLIRRADEFRLVLLLIFGYDRFFTREIRINDLLRSDIRWVADYNIEPLLFTSEDFDKGDIPNKRHTSRAPKCTASPFEPVEVFG